MPTIGCDSMPMTKLRPGEYAQVASLNASGEIRRRMQDIGLIPGTSIECIRRSPLGDPTAYRIRSALIALRAEDAGTVCVRNIAPAAHGRREA